MKGNQRLMRLVDDGFDGPLDAHWRLHCPGGGTVAVGQSVVRLALPATQVGVYADAQIDDYHGLARSRFPWRPPLRLDVRARASQVASTGSQPDGSGTALAGSYLHGTAGFGFWNCPIALTTLPPTLPDALWFFAASPPSNMALVPGLPGYGWKAQMVRAHRWGTLVDAVPAAVAVLRGRLTGDGRSAERWVQRLSGAHEAVLTASLAEWHTYSVEWRTEYACFSVDGVEVLVVPEPPPGPLGFVAWVDNQFAIATPRGALRFGTVACEPQWLELDHLRIQPL